MTRNKFNARKTTVDGETFDSKAEADRWCNLRLFERARQIRAVARQPEFPLKINGETIGHYTPDFVYYENGRRIVEDVKGTVTEAASLRMRVFQALYPDIELRIVDKQGRAKRLKLRRYAERRAAA